MDRGAWIAMAPVSDSTGVRRGRTDDLLAALLRDPRLAVEEEHIVCLICAARFRQLTNTHLRAHQLTAPEYKVRFGYNRGRPLMCRSLARLYAERAVRNGLADRIRIRPIVAQPALRRRGGMRPVTLEELLTRRDARRAASGGEP
jgi:ROS/MUCR transcriptional regulator protein.